MKHNERARVAPLYFTFTNPFRTQKTHERPPAAACGRRSPRCRSPRCRSPRCLLAAARGVERPLLCLVADAPHGDRKRPRRNAHFIGASSAHASNYQGSARGSVHLDDDGSRTTEENVLPACVTHEAAACGRSPRCLLGQLRSGVSPTTVKAIYFSRAHHNC